MCYSSLINVELPCQGTMKGVASLAHGTCRLR